MMIWYDGQLDNIFLRTLYISETTFSEKKKKKKKKDPSYARELSNIIYALLFGYTKSAEASQDSVSRFVKLSGLDFNLSVAHLG